MEKVDNSYYSNAELMELESTLESLRVNLREYLSTKSSDSMENFYDSQDEYRKLVEELNEKVYGNSSSIMEKDIRNMSENYLLLASKAVDAKRGRNMIRTQTNNKLVRDALKSVGMYQWELADLIGVTEVTLSRWFRHELPEEKQKELYETIMNARR